MQSSISMENNLIKAGDGTYYGVLVKFFEDPAMILKTCSFKERCHNVNCKFLHSDAPEERENAAKAFLLKNTCHHDMVKGGCRFKDECTYLHLGTTPDAKTIITAKVAARRQYSKEKAKAFRLREQTEEKSRPQTPESVKLAKSDVVSGSYDRLEKAHREALLAKKILENKIAVHKLETELASMRVSDAAPVVRPRPAYKGVAKTPCKFGSRCRFLASGTCSFLHE